MILTAEKKQIIYKQIEKFNKAPSNPGVSNSKPVEEAYLYVNSEVAKEHAHFFKWLLNDSGFDEFKNIQIDNILDLAFGSGSLTTHLVLDSDIDYKELFFNDKNIDNANQALKVNNSNILTNDFLDYCEFKRAFTDKKIDLLIFNPQIGGSYKKGKFNLEEVIKPIVYDNNFLSYLEEEVKINIDGLKVRNLMNDRVVFLHAVNQTKTTVEKWIEKSLFNYADIVYKTNNKKRYSLGKKIDNHLNRSNLSLIRNTIDSIVSTNHIIVFYGKKRHFDILFADYRFVIQYKTEGEDLFIARKTSENKWLCYESDANGLFSECLDESNNINLDMVNIEDTINELNKSLSSLKSLEGNELTPMKSSQGTNKNEAKLRKKKPFKNFLREEY